MRIFSTPALLLFLTSFASGSFADDSQCLNCHAAQATAWQQSDHYKSMQIAEAKTVLGRFDGSGASYNQDTFSFYRESGKYLVAISHAGQQATRYEIKYTFGFYPLQQYLAQLPQGKFQALPVAWDSRTKAEGGQRWYALTSDLEWDHFAYTWNTSCAECHSTQFQKAYDVASASFKSHFQEINVSCTACHGDASGHTAWLKNGQQKQAHAGFSHSLNESGTWTRTLGQRIAERETPPLGTQLSSCAQCHAHRTIIEPWSLDKSMLDHIQLSLISPPLYHPDGQIKEEVFVSGSFLQSKMHAAGVVCSNCHNPHTSKLKAEGNALCSQCHAPEVFDTKKHSLHDSQNAGSLCVNCHMPATTYMGVDARRDHRFGIPNPQSTINHGTPNACNQCHSDESPEWALEKISAGFQSKNIDPHTDMFAALDEQPWLSSNDLSNLLSKDRLTDIIYASALTRLNTATESTAFQLVISNLKNTAPLRRLGAVRALEVLPQDQRTNYLKDLIHDPSKSVRMTVARLLAGSLSSPALSDGQKSDLNNLLKEYQNSLRINEDNPGVQLALGELYQGRGHNEQAKLAYKRAIAIDDQYSPAYINLADLHRRMGDDKTALGNLIHASQIVPEDSSLLYALSLAYFRHQQYDKGISSLRLAHDLAPSNSDINYVYAVALESVGKPQQALTILQTYLHSFPSNVQILELSARYHLKYRHTEQALREIEAWLILSPNSDNAKALYRQAQRLDQRENNE
jgi:predicted CXXCH cytochrome family protein